MSIKVKQELIIRKLGQLPYEEALNKMRIFTHARTPDMPDELWLVEHPPVYTQGQTGKPEHVIDAGDIPVVQSDRGGQVTYHGPGQLVAYTLFNLKRLNMGIRSLVIVLEDTIIELLRRYGITAEGDREAPGVYVNGAKICSIGLRVRKGFSYHGLALNVNLPLEPFAGIHPCGFKGLAVTSVSKLGGPDSIETVAQDFVEVLAKKFKYDHK